MKRTLVHAYLQGNGISDEITTYIDLEPLAAAKYYINDYSHILTYDFETFHDMRCTHIRTDGVQEWDGEKWNDITDKEPLAVGTWKTDGEGGYIHIAPYNNGGKVTYFN